MHIKPLPFGSGFLYSQRFYVDFGAGLSYNKSVKMVCVTGLNGGRGYE